jgi:hypothetical protein
MVRHVLDAFPWFKLAQTSNSDFVSSDGAGSAKYASGMPDGRGNFVFGLSEPLWRPPSILLFASEINGEGENRPFP